MRSSLMPGRAETLSPFIFWCAGHDFVIGTALQKIKTIQPAMQYRIKLCCFSFDPWIKRDSTWWYFSIAPWSKCTLACSSCWYIGTQIAKSKYPYSSTSQAVLRTLEKVLMTQHLGHVAACSSSVGDSKVVAVQHLFSLASVEPVDLRAWLSWSQTTVEQLNAKRMPRPVNVITACS
jgi:hypothetical protein